jgi:diphthamide biosynthesis methyltransferase
MQMSIHFECNPLILTRTRNTVKVNPKVTLHEIAVSDIEEDIDFYPINDAIPRCIIIF